MQTMTTAYFDGASRGNPGESAAGACIVSEDGKVIWEFSRALGIGTNNEAEYKALIMLLEEIASRGLKKITVRGDSRLVVSQVTGKWKVREERLRPLAERAKDLVRATGAALEWVPREKNSMADALSNKAFLSPAQGMASFPPENLERVCDTIFIAHGSADYAVDVRHRSCSCPSFRNRGDCKHLQAALSLMKKGDGNCSSC